MKERFVAEVERITWAYKLAESTINLPGSADGARDPGLRDRSQGGRRREAVLAAIDKAVRHADHLRDRRGAGTDGAIRMVAAHKQLGTGAPKLGAYFTHRLAVRGQPSGSPLPTAIDLPSLYTALLQPLTPVAVAPWRGCVGRRRQT